MNKKLLRFLSSSLLLLILNSSLLILNCQSQWFYQPLPISCSIYDMKFYDYNTGVIAAVNDGLGLPYILRTTNGGNNWYTVNNIRIYQFQKINDSIIYGFGNQNISREYIYRTFNRGLSWDSVGLDEVYRGISFINKDTGWISGFDGNISRIWKTTNGGVTMTVIPLPTSIGWGKIFFLKYKINGEYYGWCSEYATMWRTTNSGINWFQCAGAGTLYQLEFMNERLGWASNSSSNILKTIDGGMNWVNQPMPTGNGIWWNQIINFRIIDSNTIYGDCGIRDISPGISKGIIWKTTNSGAIWGFQQPDTSLIWSQYKGLDFFDSLSGWSYNIHTTNGGGPITQIINNKNQIVKEYKLYQNYPNPFNPQTTIEFSIKQNSYVTFKIYDISGKEIMHIFNNLFLNNGSYKTYIDFQKTNLSSGIYFYKLDVRDNKSLIIFTETKKMSFIK